MTDKYIHETNRNTKTARATQNPGSKTVTRRPWDSRNCSNGRVITQFCSSLAGCVQKRWTKSIGKQTAAFKALQAIRQAVVKASKTSFKRPESKWLQDRIVDTGQDRTANKKTFWPIVSTFRSLVCSFSHGLELSEAGKEGQRTRRAGNSLLAKEGLATYKKKPVEPAGLPYWSMKAVLCLPQLFAVPGHQKAKHLFNIAGAKEAACRPFLLLASLHNVIDWVCIFLSRTATSGWMILKHLYRCSWNTFRKALSWFLTVRWFIAGQKEDCVRDFPDVSILNGFQLMLQSLIRSSRSGTTASTATLPTIFLMMYSPLKRLYVNLSNIFVHRNPCYVRSSKKPGLKYDSFHWLFKSQ